MITMIEIAPIITAAFVSGLLGSAHCLGMCSGLSGLFAAGVTHASIRSQVSLAVAYNLGRIASYALLGMLLGLIGKSTVHWIPVVAGPLRVLGGGLIILVGLQVAFGWRLLAPIESLGAVIWSYLAPCTKTLLPANSVPKAAGLGLLWGWLPCGLVYAALLVAATTATPGNGALVMIAFGLGTMPAMLLTGLSAFQLSRFMSRNTRSSGLLIVLIGITTLAMPIMGMGSKNDHGAHSIHSNRIFRPRLADVAQAAQVTTPRKSYMPRY